jgi:anti-sigma B factor antagonist
MKITKTQVDNCLTIAIEGRLDTTTAPELDQDLKSSLLYISELIFDFSALEYISSAGLRVLLSAQKTMTNNQGVMKIRHVNEMVMEVFEVTGFADMLTIEK